MEIDQAKQRIVDEVDRLADDLVEVSHRLHDRPELCFEEHFAHELLTDVLETQGLAPDRAAYDLDTAFRATAGSAGPTVAVLCEYDALPDIGHACGHNIIAAAGLGAGLAAASLADELGGRVVVLGTPAEEGGGGKELMAQRGAFDGVDAALMVHPADAELTEMTTLAIVRLEVEYRGKAAHAAAFPEHGQNALDAAVLGYQNVAALRQHIGPHERVHGIFTDAGVKPNIVPAHAGAHWYVRSPTLEGLEVLRERVLACLQGGADAAGCSMEATWLDPVYADLRTNQPLIDRYAANAATLGRTPAPPGEAGTEVVGSTDMGNVSHLVPSIHPMIKIAPRGVSIHDEEFADHAVAASGDEAVLDGAKAMAMTVADLWLEPVAVEMARVAFEGAGGRS